ncbi:MAG: hypothetical protein ACREIC_26230, partial [Limisphaerales bacterium]
MLATPEGLVYTASNNDVVIISTNGPIRQVKAPETFVDVVPLDAYTYEARFYLPSDFSSSTNSAGLYYPVGSPTPFVTWNIANPDQSPSVYNRLNITETRAGLANVYNYSFNGTSNAWTLDYPSGLREDTSTTTTTTNSNGGYFRQIISTVGIPGGAVQAKVKRIYEFFGNNSGEGLGVYGFQGLIQETLSPDTNPLTTTYSYYTNLTSTNINFLPLQLVVHPDGSWQYYEYLDDSSGRVSGIYSGIGDAAAPSSGPPDTNECRYTVYEYDSVDSGQDDGTLRQTIPRTETSYFQSQIVSKTYRVVLATQVEEFRCQSPTALWNDPGNLETITSYTGDNRVASVQNPDRTMAIYTYALAADGSQTNTISTGQPNGGGTAVIDGTTDVTILGPVSQPISHTVSDVVSGIVISQDIYGNYDTLNRPQQVTHLDGTTEWTHYACCGPDYVVDRDSTTNYFGYDAMKRQITSTRLGITTSTVLDPVGRTVATVRTGTDNSQITQSQSSYDLANRLVCQTNGLGGVTTYANSYAGTGALIHSMTNADGGTRIEAYFVDGSLKSVTGTGVHPVQYMYGVDGDGLYTTEIKMTNTGGTNEWVKTSTDLLGRTWKTLYPNSASSHSVYNSLGQLAQEIDPDAVGTLYQYNAKGELVYT